MAIVQYQRVSSLSQNLDRQQLDGVDKVFAEKVSAKSKDRPKLSAMIDYVRNGDTVMVHSIDRLARDLRDLQEIITAINSKGVAVKFVTESLEFNPSKTDPMSTLQLHIMGAFAQFERSISKARQAEGIAKAKLRGVYSKKRSNAIDRGMVKSLKTQGLTNYAIAKKMNISSPSVARILNEIA